ncbi:hypothetical protein SJ496_11580, partial [Providencia stuartii]|nr:hypothetical protein [Providencia stuartii]
ETGVPASACLRMVIIWLSVKRAFFIEISSVQITRKFYLLIHRFFGGITVEDQNGRKVELPLSILEANNPELAKMSVAGKK